MSSGSGPFGDIMAASVGFETGTNHFFNKLFLKTQPNVKVKLRTFFFSCLRLRPLLLQMFLNKELLSKAIK